MIAVDSQSMMNVEILNDAKGHCIYVQIGNILVRAFRPHVIGDNGKLELHKTVYVNVGYGSISEYLKGKKGPKTPWDLTDWDLKESVDAVLGEPGFDPNG